MLKTRWIALLLVLTSLPFFAVAQNATTQAVPAPFLHDSFDDGIGKWKAEGTSTKVSITHDPAHVKEGKGALQHDYSVAKNEISSLSFSTSEGSLAKAKCIRFWVMTDYEAPLIVMLAEQDGGHYSALVSTPRYKWQQVELSPSDFALNDSANDPKDPNNRLDMDKVTTITIVDFGQLVAQSDDATAKMFNIQTGPRTLYVDDFRISEETLPSSFSAVNGDVRLDTFARPQISWLHVGDMKVNFVTGKPLEGRSLQLEYHQAPAQLAAVMRRIPAGKLAGTDKITFNAASTRPSKLRVQVEEKGGGKYNALVEIPGDKTAKLLTIRFAEMTPSEDSKDTNDHLDIDQITQIVFLDLTGQMDGADADNTLWINNLRAGPK